MGTRATRRLIDASATLPPADRALLNLWLHRGLDDARLGALTGIEPDAVRARREQIIAALGGELGLPETEVAAALQSLAAGEDAQPNPGSEPSPEREPTPESSTATGPTTVVSTPATTTSTGWLPAPCAPPPLNPEAELEQEATDGHARDEVESGSDAESGAPEPIAEPERRRNSTRWAAVLAVIAILVAGALFALMSAHGRDRGRTTTAGHTPASTTTATTAMTTTAATTTTATTTGHTARHPPSRTRIHRMAFQPLPGGPRHATGQVWTMRGGRELVVDVTGLPIVRGDHYEAWLYTNIVDSQALGPVRPGHVERFRLPADAAHFHSIDISLQPRGDVNPSGESRLRAANPAR